MGVEVETTTFFLDDNASNAKNSGTLALYDILIPVIGFFVIGVNLAVVISSGLILKKGSKPRTTYLFLGNVALTDLVIGVSVVFGALFPNDWRNSLICSLQIGLIVSSTLASVYSVALIALDRFLYILHGLQYQKWIYTNRARLMILIVWLIGIIVGFLPLMGWSGDTEGGKVCWFIRLAPPGLVVLTCVCGLIPLLVIVVLYSIILYHSIKRVVLLRQSERAGAPSSGLRMFRGGAAPSTASLNVEEASLQGAEGKKGLRNILFPRATQPQPSHWRAVAVVMLTTGSFAVTWLPYFVACFVYVFCDRDANPGGCRRLQVLIASPLAILGFANSLLDPVIYAWWHKGFRTFVINKFGKNVRSVDMATNHSNSTSSTKPTRTNSSYSRNSLVEAQVNVHM